MTPETLVRDPEAPEAAPEHVDAPAAGGTPPEASVVEVERPCPSCGAALADDQDWCLECGSAADGGRSGGLPGLRTAAATIAICLALASGAVAAAYAALNAEDGPTGPTSALVAQAPVDEGEDLGAAPAIVPAPAPADTPPAVDPPAAEAPTSTPAPAPTPTPAAPVTPTYTPPADDGGDTSTGGTDENPGGDQGKDAGSDVPGDEEPVAPPKTAPLVLVDLAAATAATYDPAGRPAEAFTDPAAAIDGDPSTSWTATLTPEEIVAPDVGLTLSLGEAIGVRRLVVTPTTPGTTIEVFGSRKATPPASADSAGWIPLATQLDVQGKTRIALGDGSEKVSHLLVRFADGPVDGSPSVGIAELSVFE